MDSHVIARSLEEIHPEPPLHLTNEKVLKVRSMLADLLHPIYAEWMTKVPYKLLSEHSAPYFIRTREEQEGKPLLQMAKEEGGEPAWSNCMPAWNQLVKLLKEEEGPFFLGMIRKDTLSRDLRCEN